MTEAAPNFPLLVSLIGGLVIVSIFAQSYIKRIGIPPLVVFILLGFLIARFVLNTELIPALFIAVAFAATSVGVSVAVWRRHTALESNSGSLLPGMGYLDESPSSMVLLLAAKSSLLIVNAFLTLWGREAYA